MPSAVLTRTRALLAVALAALMALIVAPAASAHTDLESSNPAQGDTVATIDEVSLTFTSPLLDIGNELSIVDSEGTTHALEPEFPEADTIAAPVTDELAPGPTQLVWRVVAEDGHPIEGVIDFAYAPEGAAPSGTPSADASPSPTDSATASATPTPSATASATPSPSASPEASLADDEGGTAAWVWWAIGAVVVVVIAVGIAVSRRR